MTPKHLFVDANVLIYETVKSSPFHAIAAKKLSYYSTHPRTKLWVSRQVLREFLKALLAQPSAQGPDKRRTLVQQWQWAAESYGIADETILVAEQLAMLVTRINFPARSIHDANIVATMLVYGIDTILTNDSDFEPFSGLIKIIRLTD